MAITSERARPWVPGWVPNRWLLLALALIVVLGVGYVVVADPLHRNQPAPVYQTATVSQGTLQVAVNATGPISNPMAVPLSFKNSGTFTAS